MKSQRSGYGAVSRYWLGGCALLVAALAVLTVLTATAAPPGSAPFERTWQRTDQPVRDGGAARTWMWGPEANTGVIDEPYLEAPGGAREVQYFDKARMEDNSFRASAPWDVTNGLLVVELISGRLQTGDARFEERAPADVNVAGDADDASGPTYRTFAGLLDAPPAATGATLTSRVDRAGIVSDDPALAGQNVTATINDDVTNHAIAAPFWEFMNSAGAVHEGGQVVEAPLFENPYFATGRPVTEAYWATVKVAGTERDVLMQCFERRCLTYTPGNPEGFVVEAGNVGQHYYQWRYGQQPGEEPPTPTATATASPTVTQTPTTPEEPAIDYTFAGQWGKPYAPGVSLSHPRGVAIDGEGNIWVSDQWEHRLLKYDPYGRFLAAFGSQGSGDGQLYNPAQLAVDSAGNIYVADRDNFRVQVFDKQGNFVTKWGQRGAGNGQFETFFGLAVHGDLVYVADYGNNRIQVFDRAGVYQRQFGSTGDADGQFAGPMDVAVDPQGNVYVADYANDRIQKFSSTGVFLGKFGSEGEAAGQFMGPGALAIDPQGNIYVTERFKERTQKFNAEGQFLMQWGTKGTGPGQFFSPDEVALDSAGNVYVADGYNQHIQKFTGEGRFVYELHDAGRGLFGSAIDVDVDQAGNLLVLDTLKMSYDSGTLTRFTPEGNPLDLLGRARPGIGQHDMLSGAAVNRESGDVYLADRITNRVQRFDANWKLLSQWGTTGSGPGQLNGPTALAVDADDNVYVADTLNNRVQKFDANGVFLDQWGAAGSGDGQFQQPGGIVVVGERVYVVDTGNDRVQIFDRQGAFLGKFGGSGAGPGRLEGPTGIAARPDGNILVVDSGNHRVQVFSPQGRRLGGFGAQGSRPGQFNVPYGITVDDAGTVYVTDVLNARVQAFTPAG